ncbi:MAG: PEP-CTERM sorting domain-containing protein [Bryobacteraceae bacterium]
MAFFLLFMAQAVFAGYTNCVSRPNVSDGSGGYISGFDCSFYHESGAYVFNLLPFIMNGGASLTENELVPGYIVWTTNASDVANQTLLAPGSIMDVLDFDANLGGFASSQVYVDWPGGPAIPSVATMDAAGYLVLSYNASGVELFDPGDGNHTFTVDDSLPGAVPEPSTLLLVFAGGLATLIVRRRRC